MTAAGFTSGDLQTFADFANTHQLLDPSMKASFQDKQTGDKNGSDTDMQSKGVFSRNLNPSDVLSNALSLPKISGQDASSTHIRGVGAGSKRPKSS